MKILKFEASWCNPCKSMTKLMEGMQIPVPVERIDIDENMDLAKTFGIRSVPTLVLVGGNGKEVRRITGSTTKEHIESLYS